MMRRSLLCFVMLGGLAACGDKAGDDGAKGSGQPAKAPPAAPAAGYGFAAALGSDLDVQGGRRAQGGPQVPARRSATTATGGWGPEELRAGTTAFAALALIASTDRASVGSDPTIAKALDLLAAAQKESGAIHSNPAYMNYETAVAVSAFAAGPRRASTRPPRRRRATTSPRARSPTTRPTCPTAASPTRASPIPRAPRT